MKSETKIILGVIGGLFTLGCLITAGLVVLMGSAFSSLGGDGKWNEYAISQAKVPMVFGVRLPVGVTHYQVREQGFQDAMYEAVMRLPPGGAEAFLSANGLQRDGIAGSVPEDISKLIDALEPGVTFSTSSLDLAAPEADVDGGSSIDGRNATLLEGPGGEVWLYLQAFET